MILESGAELKISPASFAEARALLQAILEEAKALKVDADTEIDVNLLKDLVCTFLGSKKVESALMVCARRATYNGSRIDESTFEAVEARADYFEVCYLIAKENIMPFTKSLYAKFSPVLEKVKQSLA